ncbi:phosphate ABC transporter permease PstA [Planotetraspora phitsanulokensis]|uniref:Phosphate transport system permease protein PstA n=1 Tax=Planotetraspora phitsanulokensis TaxID=575192 RepID=A0A8J3U675_9ACTN|nr:phosphate ABC transporter permease PstA [Planotetraspora phitsanulokensis]GII37752.1 phosphate transport system permease protein PstA [Planotetraspora phitsanulokensis]
MTMPETKVLPNPRAPEGRQPASAPAAGPRGKVPPRRRPRAWRWTDLAEIAGALGASAALTWMIFGRLLPFRVMPIAYVLLAYVLFLPIYWFVIRDGQGATAAKDRLVTVLIATGALFAFAPIVFVVGYVVKRGAEVLRPNFFTETMQIVGPLSKATEGGALHSIIGTLEQLALATAIAVPLGLLTAVYLSEIQGPLARPVRLVADAMTALPSIVAGLFIFSIVIKPHIWLQSGIVGSLALAILMLPTVTIAAEQVLHVVPGGLREAALALGAPYWRSVLMVVLPTARAGLSTAVILGMARVVGETAPVLMTTGGTTVMNVNPFSGHQDNLPLFVFTQIRSSQENQVDRAWAGALVLLAVVLLLFVLARIVGSASPGRRRLRVPRRRASRTTSDGGNPS